MQLYFIRHGQSVNNAHWGKPGYRESPDPALTGIGIEQAQMLADYLTENQRIAEHDNRNVHNRYGFGITHLHAA